MLRNVFHKSSLGIALRRDQSERTFVSYLLPDLASAVRPGRQQWRVALCPNPETYPSSG